MPTVEGGKYEESHLQRVTQTVQPIHALGHHPAGCRHLVQDLNSRLCGGQKGHVMLGLTPATGRLLVSSVLPCGKSGRPYDSNRQCVSEKTRAPTPQIIFDQLVKNTNFGTRRLRNQRFASLFSARYTWCHFKIKYNFPFNSSFSFLCPTNVSNRSPFPKASNSSDE